MGFSGLCVILLTVIHVCGGTGFLCRLSNLFLRLFVVPVVGILVDKLLSRLLLSGLVYSIIRRLPALVVKPSHTGIDCIDNADSDSHRTTEQSRSESNAAMCEVSEFVQFIKLLNCIFKIVCLVGFPIAIIGDKSVCLVAVLVCAVLDHPSVCITVYLDNLSAFIRSPESGPTITEIRSIQHFKRDLIGICLYKGQVR